MKNENPEKFLVKGLEALKITECSAVLSELLMKYVQELEMFNAKLNLVKAASSKEIITAHVLDSLAAWEFFYEEILTKEKNCTEAVKIADMGSGAGFPGIPLACLFFSRKKTAEFHLIERMSRRCAMLENVCAVLGLNNTKILNKEMENLPAFEYDIITCRAFKPLDTEVLQNLKKRLKKGGKLFLYKAKENKVAEETEIIQNAGLKFEVFSLAVPFLDRERHLLAVSP